MSEMFSGKNQLLSWPDVPYFIYQMAGSKAKEVLNKTLEHLFVELQQS